MKDEIKEIKLDHFKDLEELKQNVENWIATDEMYWERWFGLYDIKALLDYITNLQEENKHLDKVNCHLRKKINSDIYKSRNEKAIEYITSEETINMFSSINAREKWLKINHKLLNILQGDDKK